MTENESKKDARMRPYLSGKVEDVMTRNPLTIEETLPISELVRIFLTHHYHALPVTDKNGKITGVVRDSEVLAIFATRDPFVGEYQTVKDIMHSPPFVIGATETIQSAAMKMFVDGTRFLVVIAKDGSIVGVVTRIDLIRGIRWKEE